MGQNRNILWVVMVAAFLSVALNIESTNGSTYTIFAPGISASVKKTKKYAKAGAFAGQQYSGIIFKDQKKPKKFFNKILYGIAKKYGKSINREKIVFGQGHDIASVKKAVDKATSDYAAHDGILFGTCRGAAAIIQHLAQEECSWVKGIVLDSSFADAQVMIHAKISEFWSKLFFPKFDKQVGKQPLDVIKNIKNKNIKVLLLFAKGAVDKHGNLCGDVVTPFEQHAKPLYDAFKACGFDVTMMSYDAVHCGGIDSERDAGDRTAYVKQVQSWYKHHGFLK